MACDFPGEQVIWCTDVRVVLLSPKYWYFVGFHPFSSVSVSFVVSGYGDG